MGNNTDIKLKEALQIIRNQEKELNKYKNIKNYWLLWEKHKNSSIIKDLIKKRVSFDKYKTIINKDLKDITNKEHLLIEWDNLYSLKKLCNEYLWKINVISIDPPYNTWTKLTYKDKFNNKENEYLHNEWLNFMHIRLQLAHLLLAEWWVILINIDEREHHRLRILMDEIFWEENFIWDFVWLSWWWKNDSSLIKNKTEYIVTYAKNKSKTKFNLKKSNPKNYKLNDKRGKYCERGFAMQWLKYAKTLDYVITAPNWEKLVPWYNKSLYEKRQKGEYSSRDWCWTLSKKEFERRLADNRIVFKKDNKNWLYKVYYKSYYEWKYTAYDNIINISWNASNKLKKMFNNKRVFDYPKPIDLITHLLSIVSKEDSIILDFFADSWTTWEAVLRLNNKDNWHRQFILCTNNEISEDVEKKLLDTGIERGSIEWENQGICKRVTYPRLEKIIKGYIDNKGKKIKGIGWELLYYTINIKNSEEHNEIDKILLKNIY